MRIGTIVVGLCVAVVSCNGKGDAPAGSAFTADQVKAAIQSHIRDSSKEGAYSFHNPADHSVLDLQFDHVHAGVHDGPDGSFYACVDFRDPSRGDVYDADVYVKAGPSGRSLEFYKFVLHKKNGQEIR